MVLPIIRNSNRHKLLSFSIVINSNHEAVILQMALYTRQENYFHAESLFLPMSLQYIFTVSRPLCYNI
ncbi:hypothetical protein LguiB_013433 [Lonicera macranthoides]